MSNSEIEEMLKRHHCYEFYGCTNRRNLRERLIVRLERYNLVDDEFVRESNNQSVLAQFTFAYMLLSE